MILHTILLSSVLLLPLTQAQIGKVTIGNPCNIQRNRLTSTSHQFLSDCVPFAYCDPTSLTCKQKGCRSEQFPFGYPKDTELPALCPSGQFCPDEEDQCLPVQPVGQSCQLDRDDQCEPAPDQSLATQWNSRGSICLHFQCYWANQTVGNPCVVDNVVYTGYRTNSSSFATIISRDNCVSPGSYCDAQALVCQPAADLGGACVADKMCLSHNCGLDNKCALAAGTVLPIPLWQYIITGAGIVGFILTILLTLFLLHRRNRAQVQREIREYFHEQTTYRSSIIALHTAARDRTSMYSASEGRFSQYDENGQMVYRDDESERHLLDGDRRRASGLRNSMIFDEQDDDSDEDRAQGRRLIYGQGQSGSRGVYNAAASRDSFGSRASLDQDTPRQSFDYGRGSGQAYNAVPGRQSTDLPLGAGPPKRGDFKDPWGN